MDDLLTSLEGVRWDVAFRTFGNSHATLIGLLVDWWISNAPKQRDRWVLEGAPSYGPWVAGDAGLCDAVLVEDGASRGVIEVEGTYHESTVKKIGKYFSSSFMDLQGLEFGVFLGYTYNRKPLILDKLIEYGAIVSSIHPGKQLAILVLDKQWEPQKAGPRAPRKAGDETYYSARPIKVRGALIYDGKLLAEERILYPKEV
jgi:hypothetical protein